MYLATAMAFVCAGSKSGRRGGFRWKAMNAKNRFPKLSKESQGSLAAALPRTGEASPSGEVSPRKPGTSASNANEAPPSVLTARPCHASSEIASVRTSFIPTAIRVGLCGCTAIDGSFCWRTSGAPVGETNGSAGKKSCVDTRTFGPVSDSAATLPPEPLANIHAATSAIRARECTRTTTLSE